MTTATGPPRLRAVGLSASPSGARSKSSRLLAHALARLEAFGPCDVHGRAVRPARRRAARARRPMPRSSGRRRSCARPTCSSSRRRCTAPRTAGCSRCSSTSCRTARSRASSSCPSSPVAGWRISSRSTTACGRSPRASARVVVSAGVYGTDLQFHDGAAEPELLARVDRAVEEAHFLARARTLARTAPVLESTSVAESEV